MDDLRSVEDSVWITGKPVVMKILIQPQQGVQSQACPITDSAVRRIALYARADLIQMGAVLVVSFLCGSRPQGCSAAQRKRWRILGGFSFERRPTVSRSMLAEQSEPSPYNHHLQQFL